MSENAPAVCDCQFHHPGQHGIVAPTTVEPNACGQPATWLIRRDSSLKPLEPKLSCDECLVDMRQHLDWPSVTIRTEIVSGEAEAGPRGHGPRFRGRHREVETERDWGTECWCFHGPPVKEGLSGHEFSPFDPETGSWVRPQCDHPGIWLGTWNCGGCPDTHEVQVCEDCRRSHDADAATGLGAVIEWRRANG